MKEIVFIIEKDIEFGYTTRAEEYSIFTEGETLEDLKKNIFDAIRCHFDDTEEILKAIRFQHV